MTETKIEPWMVAAAEHIHKLRMGSLEVQFKMGLGATHPNLSNTEQSQMAQQLTIDAIARVLVTHAPDPASVPIGPGDVVQTQRGDIYIVNGLNERGGAHVGVNFFGTTLPLTYLTRIGRAVYWPDGSKVEGGGE